MAEEPSLPGLPIVSWDERPQTFSNNPRKRVRTQQDNASPASFNSSDPAVFSSDDDPGLDNYVEGRRKKRYVGSWFQQNPASSDSTFSDGPSRVLPKAKRTLRRDFDSGVFLGSDSTDSDGVLESLDIPTKPKLPQLEARPVARLSAAEAIAQRKIQACLDEGKESVDLWALGLESISNDTIGRLSQLERIPVVVKDVAFEQDEPEFKLFLASNRLQQLPSALYDLTQLTVLSLRGNQFRELAPSICRLANLEQLNVSQNQLRYLPAEFLDFFKPESRLRDLALHPNPFLQPEEILEHVGPDGTRGGTRPAMTMYNYPQAFAEGLAPYMSRHLGRSPIQVSDSNGRVISSFRLPDIDAPEPKPIAVENLQDTHVKASSSTSNLRRDRGKPSVVPSLLEVALRSCYGSSHLGELGSFLPDDLSHLQKLLQRTLVQKETGGLTCSKCRKMIVVPVLQWIEWREIRSCSVTARTEEDWCIETRPFSKILSEVAVPFLHRACSWRCGPVEAENDGQWPIPSGYSNVEEIQAMDDLHP